jgi:glycosyltransferase involved in cell wall biosynthesis
MTKSSTCIAEQANGPAPAPMSEGAVTVVMTVYNGMPYLPASVDSILNQSLTNFEFIIVDDGSSDSTPEYLKSLTDSRIKVIHQSRSGQQAAAHRGILAASAPLIARMDSDDIAHPTRLEKQVRFLQQNADVGLVGSQITRRGEISSGLESNFPTDHESIVDDLLHNRHSMCNPATMFRRDLYLSVGGYWPHNIAEDWDMFLKIAEHAKLANLDEHLLCYRFHVGSINGRRIIEAQLYNEYAAELAWRRRDGRPEISYSEFLTSHRSQRFPTSVFFHLDCRSVALYRKGVADLHSGHPLRGTILTVASMLLSPGRVVRRVKHKLSRKSTIAVRDKANFAH